MWIEPVFPSPFNHEDQFSKKQYFLALSFLGAFEVTGDVLFLMWHGIFDIKTLISRVVYEMNENCL